MLQGENHSTNSVAVGERSTPKAGKECCAQPHNEAPRLPISIWLFLPLTLRRWWRTLALHVLVAELRSLLCRMSWALEIRGWELRGYRGQIPAVWDTTLVLRPRLQKHAYIGYMQRLSTRFPKLTIVDLHLVSQAWRGGWESGFHIGNEQSQRKQSSASPAERDSMPRPAVQQDSIRDLLAQLPSQVLRDELDSRDRSCTTQKTESQRLGDSQTFLNNRSSSE